MDHSEDRVTIDVPPAYQVSQQSPPESRQVRIEEVPGGTNKVRRIVIRGRLKHDAPPDEQKQ